MMNSIELQSQERQPYEDQESTDVKGILSLIATLEKVAEQITPDQQNTFLITLRTNREGIRKLFERRNITWGGTMKELIERLKQAATDIENGTTNTDGALEPQFLKFKNNTKEVVPSVSSKDEEVLEEREDVQEALALLEIFASGKNSSENVEVAVTPGGSVEVLFEEDIREAERLHQDRLSIHDTEKRIAEYERIIEEEQSQPEGNFFKRLFSKQNEEVDQVALSETQIKYGRAVEGLNNKIKKLENDEVLLQQRIIEKKNALGKALTLTGTEEFSGTWGELLAILRSTLQDLQSASRKQNEISESANEN